MVIDRRTYDMAMAKIEEYERISKGIDCQAVVKNITESGDEELHKMIPYFMALKTMKIFTL